MIFRRQKTLWLVPDDPDGSWWCKCRNGVVNAPWHSKALFPSGGSGWLWTCANCQRAFMFAKAALIRETLDELARRCTPRTQKHISVVDGTSRTEILLAAPEDWLAIARPLAERLAIGQRYVFLDGNILPAIPGPVKFQGLWRSHDFPELPHLSEPIVEETLANPDYWTMETKVR